MIKFQIQSGAALPHSQINQRTAKEAPDSASSLVQQCAFFKGKNYTGSTGVQNMKVWALSTVQNNG